MKKRKNEGKRLPASRSKVPDAKILEHFRDLQRKAALDRKGKRLPADWSKVPDTKALQSFRSLHREAWLDRIAEHINHMQPKTQHLGEKAIACGNTSSPTEMKSRCPKGDKIDQFIRELYSPVLGEVLLGEQWETLFWCLELLTRLAESPADRVPEFISGHQSLIAHPVIILCQVVQIVTRSLGKVARCGSEDAATQLWVSCSELTATIQSLA